MSIKNNNVVRTLFAAIAMSILVACAPSPEDSGASITISIPSATSAKTLRAARTAVPDYIRGITISVLDADEHIVSQGAIPPEGGALTLAVPTSIALVVRGTAQDAGGNARFVGQSELPPLSPGTNKSIALTLDAITQLAVIGTPVGAEGLSVNENSAIVTTIQTNAKPDQQLQFSISGGADAALFTVDAAGAVSFISPPAFIPGGTNTYQVQVTVSDGFESTTQDFTAIIKPTGSFKIGGTLSNLLGNGMVLRNGGTDLPIAADSTTFTFATPVASGNEYSVTVVANPSNPSQTCLIAEGTGSGTVYGAEIKSVAVECTTNTYTLSGSISGLSGTNFVLLNNGTPMPHTGNTFSITLASGSNYAITVGTQPSSPAQTCSVTNGSGTIANTNVGNVAVNCAINTYTVSGTITGLTGSGLTLLNNGAPITLANNAFTQSLLSGSSYNITVGTQPSNPTQVCSVGSGSGTVTNANISGVNVTCSTNAYTVGGSVSGLVAGTSLVLRNNGTNDLTLNSNGGFTFTNRVSSGATYLVTVATNPTGPSQSCTVNNASGTISNANVTNIAITCVTNAYTVGVSVTGLSGTGLKLRNNGGDDLAINASGAFTFSTPVASSAPYNITVFTQPTSPTQTCTVTNGSGTVTNTSVAGISVACTTNAYTISGTVAGLDGSGLKLLNNNVNVYTVTANGNFAFTNKIASGNNYQVTVDTQPSNKTQICSISNGSGAVAGADITNVAITCSTISYTITGTINGLAGSGLKLQNNGGNDQVILPGATSFGFTTSVPSGNDYLVSVVTQPNTPTQTCVVANGSGTVAGSNITNVAITCTTNSYTIGGTVSGLVGAGLVLQNNAGNNLGVNDGGSFAFSTPVTSGTNYAVTILTPPASPTQTCTVTNGSGAVTNANITSVVINCATNTYTVSGSITGLAGSGLALLNNSTPIPLSGNSFSLSLLSGTGYNIRVDSDPTDPSQSCTLNNGVGTVSNVDITNVSVQCVTNEYTVGGSVIGLVGTGLKLQNNGGDNLPINGNGPFEFSTKVASGGSYAVTVLTPPSGPAQNCTVLNGGGSVTNANISNVTISCAVAVTPITPKIAAGDFHTCALNNSGTVQCWGNNSSGQLGNGGTIDSLIPVAVNNLSGVTAIAAGGFHTCALTSTGVVQCWGANSSGQLGNGGIVSSSAPVEVTGLLGGAVAIVAGDSHTCALNGSGRVQCWGNDTVEGEGGVIFSGTVNSATPVEVKGLNSAVISIAAGRSHTCAMNAGGGVQCWGYNSSGQLGNNTFDDSITPVSVTGLSAFASAIAAGGSHTCAVTSAGAVQCWGDTTSSTSSSTPVTVSNLLEVSAITAGDFHTCALTNTGAVQCWGDNSSIPVAVSNLSGATAIAARANHTCALTNTGAVQCWGSNYYGELGNGGSAKSSTPVTVSNLLAVTEIAAGDSHTCALNNTGAVQCWGSNVFGELGNGSTTISNTPVTVSNLTGVTAIVADGRHSCALTSAGAVQCWGYNGSGQLGNGSTISSSTPVLVSNLSGVTSIAAGGNHTCAVTNAGAVRCWGHNLYGQLGNGGTTSSSAPVTVSNLSGVTAIAAGDYHTCAVTSSGTVLCWGANFSGSLGNGGTTRSSTPVTVSNLTGVTAIVADGDHSCALTNAGAALCWGSNYYGELGNGSTISSSTPVLVSNLSGVAAIAASGNHTCALTSAVAVQCWGYNGSGQLGNGTTANSMTPVAVTSLSSGVTTIAAGGSNFGGAHACAITNAGAVQCWGNNYYGQLGNSTAGIQVAPALVRGPVGQGVLNLLTPVTPAVAVGANHTCAVTSAGGVKCWGGNLYGQLGDGNSGSTVPTTVPVSVIGLTGPVSAVASGNYYSCALLSAGAVQCWGVNDNGQLGSGNIVNSSIPVTVNGLSGPVVAITAGLQHTCALTSAGAVQCWGANQYSQIGISSFTYSSSKPVTAFRMGSGAVAVSAGAFHTCALTLSGKPVCWGYSANGQLGLNLSSEYVAISSGSQHTCALKMTGEMSCWGNNGDGKLGNGTYNGDANPTAVTGLSGPVTSIAVGRVHSCAVTTAGTSQCWGNGGSGQLGTGINYGVGQTAGSPVPVSAINLSTNIVSISANSEQTCVLSLAGEIQCWGNNSTGQLGNGGTTNTLSPAYVIGFGG